MQEGEAQSKGMEDELLGKRNAEMADKIGLWLSHGEEVRPSSSEPPTLPARGTLLPSCSGARATAGAAGQ